MESYLRRILYFVLGTSMMCYGCLGEESENLENYQEPEFKFRVGTTPDPLMKIKKPIPDSDYYYIMDEKSQKKFAKKLESIELGLSLNEVKEIFGEPSEAIKHYDRWIGLFVKRHGLTYYVRRLNKATYNWKYDQNVTFYFNRKKGLTDILSSFDGTSKGPKGSKWDEIREEYGYEL